MFGNDYTFIHRFVMLRPDVKQLILLLLNECLLPVKDMGNVGTNTTQQA